MKLESDNMNNNLPPVTKHKNGTNGLNGESGQNGVKGHYEVNGKSGQNGTNGNIKLNVPNGSSRKNGVTYSNGKNEHNYVQMVENNRNTSWSDSEEDSDIEAEPVSGSLVLKIVSEPPATRKTSSKTHLSEEDNGYASLEPTETYLQVQVQRSTSTSSMCQPNCREDHPQRSKSSSSLISPRSRHCSNVSQNGPSNGTIGSFYGISNGPRYGSRSRQTSGATTRSGSVSPTLSESNSCVSVVDLMNSLSRQTSEMQNGMKELRDKVDNPCRNKLPGMDEEVIVLSGLNKQTSLSLRNIKNLYDETKYLKAYLEKLEAKVHYDLTIKHKSPTRPAWWRRLAVLGLLGFAIAFIIYRRDPVLMTAKAAMIGHNASDVLLTFFTDTGRPVRTTVCLMGPGDF